MLNGQVRSIERLNSMVAQTNLVALDKTLYFCRSQPSGYYVALGHMTSIRDKIQRAMAEVFLCL